MNFEPIPGVTIIGLGHKARHGKDTAATHIRQRLASRNVTRMGFADDLYAVARVIFGMTKKNGPMLQWLGTEGFRSKDPDVWVKSLYWRIYNEKPEIVVISDCRFPNEAAFIKQAGGTLVKVSRVNNDGTPFVTADRDPNHPSEIALDDFQDWDFRITAKDVTELNGEIDKILNFLRLH